VIVCQNEIGLNCSIWISFTISLLAFSSVKLVVA